MTATKRLLAETYEKWLKEPHLKTHSVAFKVPPLTDLDKATHIAVADYTVVKESRQLTLDLQNDTIVIHGDPRQGIFVDAFIGPRGCKPIDNTPDSEWEFRVIRIAAFILPESTREEWLGDLKEALYQLRAERYPRWIRTLITAGRVCLLAIALVRIRLRDLVSPTKKERL